MFIIKFNYPYNQDSLRRERIEIMFYNKKYNDEEESSTLLPQAPTEDSVSVEEDEGMTSLVISVRQRSKTVTGLASIVIKQRNERITAEALARVANVYVPLQVAKTLVLTIASISLIMCDKTAVKAASKHLYFSSIALLVLLVAMEVLGWIRTTIPLVKGHLCDTISNNPNSARGKSGIPSLIECMLLVAFAVFTTINLFGLPELRGEDEANVHIFLNITRVNLVIAYLAIL